MIRREQRPITWNDALPMPKRLAKSGKLHVQSFPTHDGAIHSLENPTAPVVLQSFEMVFQQYHRHLESKSFAPDGSPCNVDSAGLLKRYPVTATG
jgi:hypothetical protein